MKLQLSYEIMFGYVQKLQIAQGDHLLKRTKPGWLVTLD